MIKGILKILGFRRKKKNEDKRDLPSSVGGKLLEDEAGAGMAGGIVDDSKKTEGKSRPQKRKRTTRRKDSKPAAVSPSHENWQLSQFDVIPAAGKNRFHDFEIPDEIMHAIADIGFQYCTPVQAETLPLSLGGKDVIGQAQTGTGKTAVFLITILANLKKNPISRKTRFGCPRALVLVPTRELVMQVTKEAQDLGKYCNVHVVPVFGGIDYQKQKNDIVSGAVDIMVATPGRLLDFQRQGSVNLKHVEILVLDEADRMLDMGFIPDVRRIVLSTPPTEKRQTFFFSATLTPEVNHLASQWTQKAVHVEIEPEHVAVDTVNQLTYLTTSHEKYNLLYNIIMGNDLKRVMIFANRRDETRKLTDRLKRNDISCAMLSGEVSQKNRIRTLDDFRNGKIRVLVATDVAGRGIHIDEVSHVINYTLPFEPENYVHRIGRTGRAGATGISISFACEEGSFYLPEIEELLGRKLECVYPEEHLLAPAPKGTVSKETPKPYQAKTKQRYQGNRPGASRPRPRQKLSNATPRP